MPFPTINGSIAVFVEAQKSISIRKDSHQQAGKVNFHTLITLLLTPPAIAIVAGVEAVNGDESISLKWPMRLSNGARNLCHCDSRFFKRSNVEYFPVHGKDAPQPFNWLCNLEFKKLHLSEGIAHQTTEKVVDASAAQSLRRRLP
uniref:Uncharacterized protein n=1 Tax=Panagrellus redivivus TaxID=6233 RepID=A0A7E4W9Q0_PANRE